MPRLINPEEYQQKRGEILDAAQKLIYTKGYEQMSVQDILIELGISKGAFYHYFDSKQSLIEALVERMMTEMEYFLRPITDDPNIPALTKFEKFFDGIAKWKSARKAFLSQLLHIWYTDDNAILRQKVTAAGGKWMSPFMAQIIEQGVNERVFDVFTIEETAKVIISMMMSMGENAAILMLKIEPDFDDPHREEIMQEIEKTVIAYRNSIERVLGAKPGSIMLFNLDVFRDWIFSAD